jgi:membrane peptidoglycan carboxypeptidase
MLLAGVCVSILVGVMVTWELQRSAVQAHYFARLARQLTFYLGTGPSPSIRFPTTGPYNERLGYARLPAFLDRLLVNGYTLTAQARLSPRLRQLIDWGVFSIYDEKTQTGLRILDRHGQVVFAGRYPARIYRTFAEIPSLIVHTLLFIENRELLESRYPYRNPAVEWDRFAKAVFDMTIQLVKKDHPLSGGSTLATQIEKFRHATGGRTTSAADKLRQMLAASLRAYMRGETTLAAQRHIVLDYLNSLPLAAQTGYGEVHSLGDGLWAWYHADFAHVNRVLTRQEGENVSLERAIAYRQVLSLLVSQRRPSFYLQRTPEALTVLTDRYLHMVSRAGIISPAMRDIALQVRLPVLREAPPSPRVSFLERKAANVIRTSLLSLLDVPRLYDLDRLDLTVRSTLDWRVQEAVTTQFQLWRHPKALQAAGLLGKHLLDKDVDPTKVWYSFLLYERSAHANLLRIHTDNLDQPFSLNHGAKLDLGSTAKLRTLITYLEIIAALHRHYAGVPRGVLHAIEVQPADRLTRWAVHYLARTGDTSLPRMLDAAMARRYSASPAERFFTGGGRHVFTNFRRADDTRMLSVQEAFRRSVNLVFIRLMRDIVHYYMVRLPGARADILKDRDHDQRQTYLFRFIEREGTRFVRRFFHKYAGKRPAAIVKALLESVHPTPQRFAVVYGAVEPHASIEAFRAFMRHRFPQPQLTERVIQALYGRFVAAKHTWADRGYLTALHPLELWVAAYLHGHPKASRQDVMTASVEVYPHVYRWLMQTQNKTLQDRRIRTLLEEEAFRHLHKAWQRLGYPFPSLVPSYATAIGSSADRPEALAELIGIIVNAGVRYSHRHIQQVHFAPGTPYETIMESTATAEHVLHPEIAAVVKKALLDVVEEGTARRLRGAFRGSDGREMRIGGKTGTGDHRYKSFGANGRLITSQVVNRAAVFVFMIDDRFFGTLMMYVPGPAAANYRFTSSLPVQVLRSLEPTLQLLLQEPTHRPEN